MIFKMKKISFLILVILMISSCKYGDKFKVYEAKNNLFSMEYPPYLKSTQILHPNAPIQGRNGYRDIYFLVDTLDIKDSVKFDMAFDSLKNDLMKSVKEPLVETEKDTLVNGLFYKTIEISGTIKDKRILFYLNLAQGKHYAYHIAAWHFNSKRELWGNDMSKLIYSLKELK